MYKSLALGLEAGKTEEGLPSSDSTSNHLLTFCHDRVTCRLQGIVRDFALVEDIGNMFHKSRRVCLLRHLDKMIYKRERGSCEMPNQ